MSDWYIYRGTAEPHDGIETLPPPPLWRSFTAGSRLPVPSYRPQDAHRAISYRPTAEAIEQVNAALYLRRPLLVTGRPGTGKSQLADSVAFELGLGPVLHWPITSQVTLRAGLYHYDPLTRLYRQSRAEAEGGGTDDDIGEFIRLGPLGTALLPHDRPRVLLIDEIDKSDIDLPNDLLTVFEKGEYEIPELSRLESETASVMTADSGSGRVPVTRGVVQCQAFPLVIMTSNDEREFPPAFLRRCVKVRLPQPDAERLGMIVQAHLGPELSEQSRDLIERFLRRREIRELATDQLLNAVYLLSHTNLSGEDRLQLAERITPYLDPGEDEEETDEVGRHVV
ncbi:AAA family ATPase [Sphaerisporangium dianthi]|uniref:AAA family ATPase n=1 Tax=Sphaerisporangium dianthi TaxID=1436120 RepID=A0ABV9CN85_9ACTN